MQAKLNITKLKPALGTSYAIQPVNGSGLFYSSQNPHGAVIINKCNVNNAW